MSKFKHNKKRNIAFAYEALIQELAKVSLNKNKEEQKKIISIIKENFSKNSELRKELMLYNEILSLSPGTPSDIVEKVLNETKYLYSLLSFPKLSSEKDKLLKDIKQLSNINIFSNFVSNYKTLASISQIFNRDVSIKTRILLENELVKDISNVQESKKEMEPIDNLVLKTFVEKFNKEYQHLLPEQKQLLSKYIQSFADNGLELKIFLNEELKRLKQEISKSLVMKEFITDNIMTANAKEILSLLESFAKLTSLSEEQITQIIKVQTLVKEITSDGTN